MSTSRFCQLLDKTCAHLAALAGLCPRWPQGERAVAAAGPRRGPRRGAAPRRAASVVGASGRSPAPGATGPNTSSPTTCPRPRTSTTRSRRWKPRSPRLQAMLGTTLLELATDPATGEITPVLTIVTDNGGPFRSFRFQAFIATHPELKHVRTRVKSPGQNGSARTRLRYVGVGEVVLRTDRQRPRPTTPPRCLPPRIHHRPPPRRHRLQPATGGSPRPSRPPNPLISIQSNPANYLTRDTNYPVCQNMQEIEN